MIHAVDWQRHVHPDARHPTAKGRRGVPKPTMSRTVSFEWGPTAARGLPGAVFMIATAGGEEVEVVYSVPQDAQLDVLCVADDRVNAMVDVDYDLFGPLHESIHIQTDGAKGRFHRSSGKGIMGGMGGKGGKGGVFVPPPPPAPGPETLHPVNVGGDKGNQKGHGQDGHGGMGNGGKGNENGGKGNLNGGKGKGMGAVPAAEQ